MENLSSIKALASLKKSFLLHHFINIYIYVYIYVGAD